MGTLRGRLKSCLSITFYYYSACSCSEGLTLLVSPENKPLDTEMIILVNINLQDTFCTEGGFFSKFRFFNSLYKPSRRTIHKDESCHWTQSCKTVQYPLSVWRWSIDFRRSMEARGCLKVLNRNNTDKFPKTTN